MDSLLKEQGSGQQVGFSCACKGVRKGQLATGFLGTQVCDPEEGALVGALENRARIQLLGRRIGGWA